MSFLKKFFVTLVLIQILFTHLAAAQWLAGYGNRKSLTFDGTSIAGSLTDFPVLVHISSDTDLASDARSDGFDIAFTDADGTTLLDHEILSFNNGTGEYLAWVKMDLVNATNKTVYMYYGNAGVSTDPSSNSTWDNNFMAVLHLQESGSGTTDEFLDATANSAHGTGGGLPGGGNGTNTPNLATGVFGSAQDFNAGNNDRIRLQTIDDDAWTAVTVQAWINPDDTGDDRIFGKCWGTGGTDNTWLLRQTGGNLGTRMRTNTNSNGGFDPGTGLSTGNWQLAAVTWDASDNTLRVFLNGVQVGSTGLNGATMYNPANTDNATLGNIPGGGRAYDGQLQEARVSDVARSANWLLTQFNIENAPASFITTKGAEESCSGTLPVGGTATATDNSILSGESTTITLSGNTGTIQWQSSTDNVSFSDVSGQTSSTLNTGALTQTTYYRAEVSTSATCIDYSSVATVTVSPAFTSGYCYRKLISIDHTKVSGSTDLTDFPMLVNLVDPDLRSTANNGQVENVNGYDIMFTDDAGNALDHEIESYVAGSGEYVAWVRIPTLSATETTNIYMSYGNSAIVADPSATSTWTTDYKAIWHLNNSFLDATSNNNDGTEASAGSTDDVEGFIANGRSFTGVTNGDSWINVPNSTSLNTDITNQVTLEAWARFFLPVPEDSPFMVKGPAINQERYMLGLDGNTTTTAAVNSRVTTADGHFRDDDGAVDATWHHIVMVYDGSLGANPRKRVYVDGVLDHSDDASGNISNNTDPLYIGRRSDDRRYRGVLDELRVLDVALSADWVATEYANQNDPSSFYTVGAQDFPLNGGTATAVDNNLFFNQSTTINLAGEEGGGSIQWQSSVDNADFSDIGGGTINSLSTGNLSITTYFRAKVSNGSCEAFSNTVQVIVRANYITDYTFRKKITIDHEEVSGNTNLSNFPLLVSVTDVDLAQATGKVQNANGYDIAFALTDGTLLDHDLELYDGTTGQYIAWVRVPTLFVSADTEIFMYYGNCSYSGGDPSSTATYDANYLGVYHFNDDLDAGTTVDDRTSNGNNGTTNGNMTNTHVTAAGQVGNAFNFGGGNDWVNMGQGPLVSGSNARTIEMWARAEDFGNERGLFQAGTPDTEDFSIHTDNGTVDNWVVEYDDTEEEFSIENSLNNWEHFAMVYDGTTVYFYHDGVLFDQSTRALNTATGIDLEIARWDRSDIGDEFDGQIDEVKISDTNRSTDWIKTEYNNQSNPSNFYQVGNEFSEFQWTAGNSSVDWEDASNWSFCGVPEPSSDIIIPSSLPFYPELDQNRTINYLQVGTGTSVDIDAFNLTIEGDISNDGTITGNTGTITLAGTSKQDIYGSGTANFNNLTLNNANNVELGQGITVNNTLTFTSGMMILNDNDLSIGNTGSITGFSSSQFVVTNGSGELCQDGIGLTLRTGNIVFPVGLSTTSYSPVTLTNAGTADQFCVGICNNVYEGGGCSTGTQITSESLNKTWFISEAVGGGSDVTITIQWPETDEQGDFERSDSFISHYTGGFWERINAKGAATVLGGNAYSLTASNVTSFSPFGIGSGNSALPVQLLSLEAIFENDQVILDWSTAAELNNNFFAVERSFNGIDFVEIGQVPGAGTTNEIQHYTYVDKDIANGIIYYRLRQVDFDGVFEFSPIVSANVNLSNFLFDVFPNPSFDRNITVLLRNIGHPTVKLSVTNLSGVSIKSEVLKLERHQLVEHQLKFGRDVPKGIYILKINAGSTHYVKKLIIAE